MKQEFLIAYRWMFGGTKTEAEKAYKNSNSERIKLIIDTWKNQCRKTFYYD